MIDQRESLIDVPRENMIDQNGIRRLCSGLPTQHLPALLREGHTTLTVLIKVCIAVHSAMGLLNFTL